MKLPETTGLSEGSTQMIFTEEFLDLRNLPAPDMVAPEPDPHTKISTLPAVSSQISGPEMGEIKEQIKNRVSFSDPGII